MLTLFKNITKEVTDFEKTVLVPMLIDTLQNTHEKKQFKGKELSGWFKACGHHVTEPRIRKMVNYIRVMNLMAPHVLIGTSNGYFITDKVNVVDDQIESLQGRIDSQMAVIDSMKAQKLNLLHLTKTA